jgi:hypothetical protein
MAQCPGSGQKRRGLMWLPGLDVAACHKCGEWHGVKRDGTFRKHQRPRRG